MVFQVDHNKFIDLSIPLQFNGPQPNAYGAERAVSKPCEAGSLVGDTRLGGSLQFRTVHFHPALQRDAYGIDRTYYQRKNNDPGSFERRVYSGKIDLGRPGKRGGHDG